MVAELEDCGSSFEKNLEDWLAMRGWQQNIWYLEKIWLEGNFCPENCVAGKVSKAGNFVKLKKELYNWQTSVQLEKIFAAGKDL